MENDTYRPAFFEIYAAEHLSAALRPALRFVLEVLSLRYPTLIRIAALSDEIFTGLLLILETSQLRKDSAMLAESFYSLRRSPVLSFHEKDISPSPLSTRQIFLSVILSVVMPHVKARVDMWYSNATGGAAAELFAGEMVPLAAVDGDQTSASQSERPATSHHARSISSLPMEFLSRCRAEMRRIIQIVVQFSKGPAFRRLILKWYPRVSSVCEGINLWYNVMYLFGHTKHFTLSLAVQRLVLRRASTSELLQTVSGKTSFFPPGSNAINLSRIISVASERILAIFKAGFFASIFAFRFLQYYYAAEVCVVTLFAFLANQESFLDHFFCKGLTSTFILPKLFRGIQTFAGSGVNASRTGTGYICA